MKKTFIIAEAGVNHNGSIELAYKLIDAAVNAKVDAIKFQTFKTENIVVKNAPKAIYQIKNTGNNESQFEMIKKLELSYEDFRKVKTYCDQKNIEFLSTGDYNSLEFLSNLGVNSFKIPSGEIDNHPYLKKVASFKKKIILSTGMSTLKEIASALKIITDAGTPKRMITVLHCNTEYPTPYKDVNLMAMLTIRDKLKVKIGYSDHTEGIEVAIAAATLGAKIIEKHLSLDKRMKGPDHQASLEPNELKSMVSAIRNIDLAFGSSSKKPSKSEIKNIKIVRKSIYYANALKKGHILTEHDLVFKRPGIGISPMKIDQILGHSLLKSVAKDSHVQYEDFL